MDQLSKSYQILGLEAGSSPEQVKQAYRDLVNVWHPDRFSHDARLQLVAQEKMKAINGAYEFLKASFFEAGITSTANPETATAEPIKESQKTKGSHLATWIVFIFAGFAVIGAAVFFLNKRGREEKAESHPSNKILAINETNDSASVGTNSSQAARIIEVPVLLPGCHALDFDGNKSHVEITTTGSLTGTFTVECWALSKQAGALGNLISSRGPKDYSFDVKFGGSGINGDIGDGSNWLTTKASVPFKYSQDKWYHIAYVVTPGHYLIYLNGVLSASKDDSTGNPVLYDADHPFITMAALYPESESLNGLLSEVRIWRTARSQAQIQANMYRSLAGTETGLQGYWRFNEGTGTTAADSSRHGFAGTLIGNVRWTTNAPPIIFQ